MALTSLFASQAMAESDLYASVGAEFEGAGLVNSPGFGLTADSIQKDSHIGFVMSVYYATDYEDIKF